MACLALLMACMAGVCQAHLVNNLVHDSDLPLCSSLLHRASNRPGLAAPMPPDLRGRWFSTSCETRPGPRYVLRSYTFHRDGSFHLSLHTYRDPSCAHPAHTLGAHGRLALGRPSWVTPGGTEAEYTLTRVEVVAHTHRDAALVASTVNASCPGKVTKPWKPHKPHTVLSYTETVNEVTEDEDCSRGLGGAWHELQLLRVEVTSPLLPQEAQKDSTSAAGPRKELLLGDLHTDVNKQDIYRPTGYQPPLLNAKYGSECGVCGVLGRSSERSPAHLAAGPVLPLLVAGAWASSRCETRPYGMFLTRNLIFSPAGQEWSMVLRYYHDPECSRPSFTLKATGTYAQAAPTPYAHDFNVTRLVLTPEDYDMASALSSYKGKKCGQPGRWAPKKAQDVTSTGGCQAMGVRVPVVEREILRTGVDEEGGMWLTLGQTPTSPLQASDSSRPTSWGPPLISCKSYNSYNQDNSLRPMMGARTASLAPPTSSKPVVAVVLAFLPLFRGP